MHDEELEGFYLIFFLEDLLKKLIRVVPKQFTLEIV